MSPELKEYLSSRSHLRKFIVHMKGFKYNNYGEGIVEDFYEEILAFDLNSAIEQVYDEVVTNVEGLYPSYIFCGSERALKLGNYKLPASTK